MKKLWKWLVGIFTFVVGILVLSGKKNKKVKEIKHKIRNNEKKVKAIDTKINSVKEESEAIKKSLESKKKALKEIEKEKFKKKNVSVKEASNFLKKYAKKKK